MVKNKSGKSTSQKKLPSSATAATQPTPTAAIKQECDRASNAWQRGNPAKALRLLKEAALKFQNEPLFHREAAGIIVRLAGKIDDHNIKIRHLKTAAESLKKALALSPNSVEFACFYATLLLDVADEPREYDLVMAECERALALENPIDPATEELERDNKLSYTAVAKAARIAEVHSKLKTLVQRTTIAKLSLWLKDWTVKGGGDEDKLKLAPVRRSVEDPLAEMRRSVEDSSEMARRPPKLLEEKRKEIEVRVAAARLIQQRSELEAVEKSNQEDSGEKGSFSARRKFSVFGATLCHFREDR